MNTTKHTPTPWGYCYDGSSDWSIGEKTDPQGREIASVWDRNDARAQANVKFIVKACNSHDALVEALRYLIALIEENSPHLMKTDEVIDALAAVEEKS